MNRKMKACFWLFGGAIVLVLLFAALLVLAPWIINTEAVKKRIESFVSQKTGSTVEYEKVEFSLFPYPGARADQVRISIPGTLDGTIRAIRIYPELMPLLKGEVRILKFHIEAPDVTLSLPEKRSEERMALPTLRAVQDKIASLLTIVESKIPGSRAEITNGNLELSEAGQSVFSFRNIEGQFVLPSGALQIDVSCTSNLWERLSVKGMLNPKSFKGEGALRVDHFLPHVLSGYLLPDTLSLAEESKVSLDVRFRLDGPGALQAELQASALHLAVQRGHGTQVMGAGNVQATLSLDDEKAMVSLTRLSLDVPKLDLVGTFEMDRKASGITLELEGRDVTMGPLREAALSIAGDVPLIRQLCDIVRGGAVPHVLFQARGSSMADLGALENIFIRAGLRDGRIYIRGPDLDLDQVNGDAVISKGVLKGDSIEARLGSSRGLKGRLTLGLTGDDPAFDLDVLVQTDLAALAPLAKRLVTDEAFQEEISRIDNLSGHAEGRLMLGKSLSSIFVRAEISAFRLSAAYSRLPYSIEITQGQMVYDGFTDSVSVQNLGGKLGTSLFSGMTGLFSYGKNPLLEVLSGKLLARLDEIYPWLASLQGADAQLKDIRSVKGLIDVSEVRLQGSPSTPEQWRFDATGEIRDVSVNTSFFEDAVRVAGGTFNVTPQKLSFTDVQGQVLDASLRVSGALTHFLAGPVKTDVTLSGTVGAEATRWISKVAQLPADPVIRPPFSISQAHLTLEGEGATTISFQGQLSFDSGPDVSMDLVVTPQEVTVRDLLIQDTVSRAAIALTLGENVVNMTFSGELHSTTLDRMLLGSELPVQWMKGNLQARIRLDQPWLSTAEGNIEGREIHFTVKQIGHVEVERVSLEAEKNNVRVNSADFTWKKQPFSLNGTASVSPKGIEFDMDLSTRAIAFETIRQALLGHNEAKEVKAASPSSENPSLKGILRFKTDRFTYGNSTWMPLHADVSFREEGVTVEVIRGSVCEVSTPGTVTISDEDMEIEIRPTALNQELEPAILCFTDRKTDITGTFSLDGRVSSKGKSGDFMRSLQGNIRFTARKGQIFQHPILARIFTFLNVTEIFRGRLPDFSQGGFLYDSFDIQGEIRGGTFVLRECVIDGRTVDITAGGEVDMSDGTLNIAVLVTPFKTLYAVVKHIPLVGYIFGGTLFSMPVKVTGDLQDPRVDFLSPSEIGSHLLSPMKRLIQLPFKIIDPFLPGETGK